MSAAPFVILQDIAKRWNDQVGPRPPRNHAVSRCHRRISAQQGQTELVSKNRGGPPDRSGHFGRRARRRLVGCRVAGVFRGCAGRGGGRARPAGAASSALCEWYCLRARHRTGAGRRSWRSSATPLQRIPRRLWPYPKHDDRVDRNPVDDLLSLHQFRLRPKARCADWLSNAGRRVSSAPLAERLLVSAHPGKGCAGPLLLSAGTSCQKKP